MDIDKSKIFKQLFDKYFKLLMLNARKYIHDNEEAEEIVQDIFVKFWEHLQNLPVDTDFKAYLYMAVHNSCQNYIKHKIVLEKHKNMVLADGLNVKQDVQTDIEQKEMLNHIYDAINQLPEKWRTVFVMNRFEEFKYREIAEKLDISQKTVEKYISKSLHFLQEKLKDYVLLILLVFKCFFK